MFDFVAKFIGSALSERAINPLRAEWKSLALPNQPAVLCRSLRDRRRSSGAVDVVSDATPDRVVLAGARRLQSKDKIVGVPEPGTRITVGLYLADPTESPCRPGSSDDFAALDRGATRAGLADQRRAQYAEAARQADIFAGHHGLRVTDVDFAKRRIRLTGTLGQIAEAFGTKFVSCRTGRRACRSHITPVQVPKEFAPWTRGALGLDTRPRLRRRLRAFAVNAQGAAAGLWPADIAQQVLQGGTSAVAPLWAAFIALTNAERGVAIRRIHPLLYGDGTLFRSVVSGNNKVGLLGYEAGPGWNAVPA